MSDLALPSSEPAIQLDRLTKRYGTLTAVNELTLTIARGSTFGLIGPNGAGKTTSFSAICGYLKPSAGQALVLGHRAGDVGALKGRLGALPQDARLPANDRVADVLTFYARLQGRPARVARREAEEALERAGLGRWGKVRCGALSHGMAKRVGIAQAFLGDPEVVLLDEPTAGLDPKHAFQLREELKLGRKSGRTLVISSHNLHELEELCDAAAILDRGRLVAVGTMAELTGQAAEVRIQVVADAVPESELAALRGVARVGFQAQARLIALSFDPAQASAEDVISGALRVLLAHNVPISAVSKGRSLESRVMELL